MSEKISIPVFYRVVAGDREFTRVISVLSVPQRYAPITLGEYEFIVKEEIRQDLNHYLSGSHESPKEVGESIILVPSGTDIDNEAIQKSMRAMKGWDETDSTLPAPAKDYGVKIFMTLFIILALWNLVNIGWWFFHHHTNFPL